jgi:MOSC domain-containing protein
MVVGTVVSLWRYPVKSMMGEELNASVITERGLLGDRAYALMDRATGKVASVKHPRKWKKLFDCHADYVEPPKPSGATLPPVWITLPDGTIVRSEQNDIDEILSNLLEREVELRMPAPRAVSLEEYWPDIEGLTHRETVTDEAMPPETFFDLAPVHILATATINRLRELYQKGRFEVRRFRPNIVVEPSSAEIGFVDDSWIGHSLSIGDKVRLTVTGPCPRCVMITMPQGDLPADPGILRTAAQHNQANIGIYASVVSSGTVHRGDPISLD